MDDLLHSGVHELGYQQVALLRSGLDTRAFRLPYLANVHLYELEDCSEILNYRMQTMQNYKPHRIHHLIPADLSDSQSLWVTALLNANYQPQSPTVWIVEGVSMYLQASEAHELFNRLSKLSSVKNLLEVVELSSC
jgi:methyltransferase (TIGR00027 family)